MTDKESMNAERRRRVQILKRLIIGSLIASIAIPVVLCIILFIRVCALENRVAQLTEELETQKALQASAPVEEKEEDTGEHGFIIIPGDTGEDEDGDDQSYFEEEALPEDTTRKVYLTFDDGPSSNTDDILDVLAAYDVKATFFVVGKEGTWAEEAYRQIVEQGHTLGMHSYTHDYDVMYTSVEDFAADMSRLQEYLYDVTGVWSRYVRFPGGSSNKVSHTDMKELIAYLNEQDLAYYDWNISSKDASNYTLSAEEIVNNCMDGIEKYNNVVILMHDAANRDTTVDALPILIEKIQAMENTELLPITEDTVPVQHITITQDETEE